MATYSCSRTEGLTESPYLKPLGRLTAGHQGERRTSSSQRWVLRQAVRKKRAGQQHLWRMPHPPLWLPPPGLTLSGAPLPAPWGMAAAFLSPAHPRAAPPSPAPPAASQTPLPRTAAAAASRAGDASAAATMCAEPRCHSSKGLQSAATFHSCIPSSESSLSIGADIRSQASCILGHTPSLRRLSARLLRQYSSSILTQPAQACCS